MKLYRLLLVLCSVNLLYSAAGRTQSSSDVYAGIADTPSHIRWCLPQAGDDPAHIIGGRCKVYKDCLDDLNLDEKIDQPPYPNLSGAQVAEVRKCHQALYNAARSNPQLKGSAATQDWLEHKVLPGTEAKSFAVPNSSGQPR
jgi:hypothetical protein